MLAASAALVLALVGGAFGPGAPEHDAPQVRKVREGQFSASILALDLAATSNLAAIALSDGGVRLWRIDTGQAVHALVFPEPDSELRDGIEVEPMRVRFSPDGKRLGVSHLSRIHLYDTATWHEVFSLGIPGENAVRPRRVPTLARRPAHEEEQTAQEMNREFTKKMAAGDGATRITDFAFTPDGSAVLAGYCRGACYDNPGFYRIEFASGADPCRLWDVQSGRILWERTYDADAVVERVVTSPDGKLFAAVSKRPGWTTVQVHSLRTGERLYSLPSAPFLAVVPPSIRFTPDGKYFITFLASPRGKERRPWEYQALYDPRTGAKVAEFAERIGAYDADISPDGRWLATPTSRLITFKIYDVLARRAVFVERREFPWGWRGPRVDTVRFDPAGSYLVVASGEAGRVAVYQIAP